jgi:hypothetical protein
LSPAWGIDFLKALHAAARVVLGGEGSEATVGNLIWPGDFDFLKLHRRPLPLRPYFAVIVGEPPGGKSNTRIVAELTTARRLVAGLLDEHWAEIVSEVSALDARAAA